MSFHGNLLKFPALHFRQGRYGNELDDINDRQQTKRVGETAVRRQVSDDDGSETTKAAADVEDDVLGGGASLGGIVLCHECAQTTQHAIGKRAHDETANQQGRRVGELAVCQHGQRRANLVHPERITAADAVAELAEDDDAQHHAGHRHRGPQRALVHAQAQLIGQVIRQPRNDAEVAKVLNRRHQNQRDSNARRAGIFEELADGIVLFQRTLGLCLFNFGGSSTP